MGTKKAVLTRKRRSARVRVPARLLTVPGGSVLSPFLSRSLEMVQQEQIDKTSTSIVYRQFAQAAVAAHGPLVGKTIRDCRFRTRYNAAVVAVHRQDMRVPLRVPDIVLQANDVLLLSCDPKWCVLNCRSSLVLRHGAVRGGLVRCLRVYCLALPALLTPSPV